MKFRLRARGYGLVPPLLLTLTSCDGMPATNGPPAPVIGGFENVQPSHLIGEYTCFATGRGGEKFSWKLTEGQFDFTEKARPLPQEMLDDLLGPGITATAVTGSWALAAGALTVSQIEADGKPGFPAVVLEPFRTPVVRLNFGKTQYVLGPK
ncbi:MAG: hypothetical protein JWN86_2436 [Planctomycetota bacterium]|nr:hypothetical protein [Planctomycetota bacterium]